MSDVQRRAVDALRTDGIAAVRFEDLLGADLWQEAAADIEPFIRETEAATQSLGDRPGGKEELIMRRFYAKKSEAKHVFSIDSPWLRIAASPAFVDIVNAYRETPTRLFYIDNWYTVPFPRAEGRVASQRWHRDPEDAHVVKVFTYFSDVDEEAGPFEYVRSSTSGGRYGSLWPWEEGHDYVPGEDLERAVAAGDRLTMTGPRGTVIFCDTGGFHRGGFARTKPRILSTFTYLRSNVKKGKRRFDVDFGGREDELPPQVRAALA